jgi:transposase
MEVIYPCCCGLDVHKKSVTACVLWAEAKGKSRKQKKRFGTFTHDLLQLADWLAQCGVTHAAMESTGVYWKPVWNILAEQFEVLLVNAQHIKAVPGRKTDQKDSEWIADLLQHGLLRGSFVPPQPIRELRDLTRYRVSLVQEINRIANRIQKVLEDANIKLASVASDALGASGRAILEAMLAGEQDAARLAEMAQGKLRNKIPELKLALEGRMTEHHRFLLRQLFEHLRFTESKLREIEQEIDKRMLPFEDKVTRLCTIPGVDRVTACGMLAEIGMNMNQFPSSGHLASWACLCPGSFESAGKRLSGKMRKGNVSLRRCLSQAAWAISMMKNNYLSALYRRIAARRGAKRAVMAVAHALLVIAYHMLKRKEDYRELGADHFDRIDVNRIRRSLVNRLERLGHKVTLEPLAQTA